MPLTYMALGDFAGTSFVMISMVIYEILVPPSPEQYTLHPICSLLSLNPPHPSSELPKVHCITLMPLHPHSLAPTYE